MGILVTAATRVETETDNLRRNIQSRTMTLKETVQSFSYDKATWRVIQRRINENLRNAGAELTALSLDIRRLACRAKASGKARIRHLDDQTRIVLSSWIGSAIEELERAKRFLERNSSSTLRIN